MLRGTHVLIADESPLMASRLSESLAAEGCLCEPVSSVEAALNSVRNLPGDVVICDVSMAGAPEFELLTGIKALQPNLPVIVGSAQASVSQVVEAMKHGAFEYVQKPFNVEMLLGFIRETVERPHHISPLPPRLAAVLDGELV